MFAAEMSGRIQGHRVCGGAPPVSHLLFADDSIFFCKASVPQAVAVKEVLGLYERASGQTVNVQKSNVVFAKGVPTTRREEILITLDMREVLSHEKYLGLPTFVGRSRNKPFLFLKDKIRQHMSVWMDRLLSWAGREVLIKAVAQAIPTYAMSVFKLPTTFCKTIQSLITRFWWSNDPQKRKIHWLRSERLCDKKEDGGLGFREMEAFNDAMLAKQVWRLLHQETSLVYKILKARYFPHGQMMSAELGTQPSYTWRSLWGAREVIQRGSRWLIGNGDKVRVWRDRWLPRPYSFAPVMQQQGENPECRVAELIDKVNGRWDEETVRSRFMPCDAELILSLPLCPSWPEDKIIWHFTTDGEFSVRSAYHVARARLHDQRATSSTPSTTALWKTIWRMDAPPRIKLFGWKVGSQILATKVNLATRLQLIDMRCEICGAMEESDVHALFLCPFAVEIWGGSGFEEELWREGGPSALAVLEKATTTLSADRLTEFVAIMWECWNARNRFIFGDENLRDDLAQRAIRFVHSFREMKERGVNCSTPEMPCLWAPPSEGLVKVNFDAGKVDATVRGWGCVFRDHTGEVILTGVSQQVGFQGAVLEEAGACLFAMRVALEHGFRRIVMEGDCLTLISLLQRKECPNNVLGFFISDILSLLVSFEFVSWVFVKRGGNGVAHALAKYQPIICGERIWAEDVPEVLLDLASKDMCTFLEQQLI